MSQIKELFGTGGANLVPGGAQGEPTLAETLRDIADDLAAVNPGAGDWSASLPVTTHICVLPAAGVVVAVDGVTGTSAGPKAMVYGSPAAGQVNVAYTAGVATLTFEATDAITACRVIVLPAATIKTVKA